MLTIAVVSILLIAIGTTLYITFGADEYDDWDGRGGF